MKMYYMSCFYIDKETLITRITIVEQNENNCHVYHRDDDGMAHDHEITKKNMFCESICREQLDESFARCLLFGWGHKNV